MHLSLILLSAGTSEASSKAQHVHQLLASIPQDLLAQAAAQCGAHARALLHYETHLRSKEGGGLNPVAHRNIYYSDDEVSFLQVQSVSLVTYHPVVALPICTTAMRVCVSQSIIFTCCPEMKAALVIHGALMQRPVCDGKELANKVAAYTPCNAP